MDRIKNTLGNAFRDQAKEAVRLSKSFARISEENVFQEANGDIRPHLDKIVETLILPGSGIEGMENLEELYSLAESGKSCLLLPEHYSNLDLSLITYLVEKAGGRGEEISRSIIAIAGMKLSEENPVVSALASAYTRIVICPSRSFRKLDPETDKAEINRGNAINRAAMKAVIRNKYKGKLILIFPSGTRYRPGHPSTKQGVREIDSYIRSFDYMCLVAINGQVLHVRPGNMMDDEVTNDIVRLGISPVIPCGEFRDRVRSDHDALGLTLENDIDAKKQAVADAVMKELEKMHLTGEETRKRLPAD